MKFAPLSVAVLGVLAALAAAVSAQGPAPDAAPNASQIPAPLPADPVALWGLAFQMNGLHGSDLRPWHLRATWRMTDEQGLVADKGSFEEWWAGDEKIRATLIGSNLSQTWWTTSGGSLSTEGKDWPPLVFLMLYDSLQRPLFSQDRVAKARVERKTVRGQKLECVKATRHAPVIDVEYCFSDGLPAIRMTETRVTQATFNSIIQFQGRYLARDINIYRVGMPSIQIHLDKVESLDPAADSDFAPQPDAVAAAQWLQAEEQDPTFSFMVSGHNPDCLAAAGQQHVRATVQLSAVIRTNGTLGSVEVIGGPQALQRCTLDAVRAQVYRPVMLGGNPVEVRTVIEWYYEFH